MKTELIPPHMQLAIMSRQYVVSRAIHALAHLGVADHMSEQPISVEELARLTSTIPELLNRILSFLTDYGLFIKIGTSYALTPLSSPLRQDDPHSIKNILAMVDESWWQAFSHLETELKTGTPAFEQQHGTDFFTFLKSHPEKKERFAKGLAQLSTYDDLTIAQGFDFNQFKNMIIFGEKNNHLSEAIKSENPDVTINFFNLNINESTAIPPADAYLFKGLLHDFDEVTIKKILSYCYQQMPAHSSLMIAEQVIPDNDGPHTNKTMDIIMMVLVGGTQRTAADWQKLVESLEFKFKNTCLTEGIFTIIEFSQ